MANHVYFNISIEGLTDEEFNSSVKMVKGTRNDYDGNPYDYEDYAEIEKQPFMDNVDKSFDKDDYLLDSYDWYCREVGAKWCHIEEVHDCYITGYSAWRQPVELVLNILEYFANKYDDNVSATMTYEDEFRNFLGKQHFDTEKYDDWDSVEGEIHETDGEELIELFNEMYPSIDTTVEDFDWHGEYEVEGESVYPSEMLDQLADEFWESS
tara:strand:+ start:124 stop:753 length:630 start_codon:yes stop_codon:yes gene_type:complete